MQGVVKSCLISENEKISFSVEKSMKDFEKCHEDLKVGEINCYKCSPPQHTQTHEG